MTINKIYFPPVGFGLWFQLGVLNNLKVEEYELFGGSGGAITCMLSILKEEDREFSKIIPIANKIRKNSYHVNFYYYLDKFIENIYTTLQTYNNNFIKDRLQKINIEVSSWGLPPTRKFIKPTSLVDLRHLVIASCYFPLLFVYKNPFYYHFNNEYLFDGFFSGFSNVPQDFIKIDSYSYATIVPLSKKHFRQMYQDGLHYQFHKKNTPFTIFTFIQMSLHIARDLIKYPFIQFFSE